MLAQLHLFLVVEIHHHQEDAFPGSSPTRVVTASPQSPADSTLGQLCAACQVARHGVIHPVENAEAAFRLPESDTRPQPVNLVPFSGFRFLLTGRSPPRFP